MNGSTTSITLCRKGEKPREVLVGCVPRVGDEIMLESPSLQRLKVLRVMHDLSKPRTTFVFTK